MQKLLGIITLLVLCGGLAGATPCDPTNLPEPIRSLLATTYAGWTIVTPARLEMSDRETWEKRYSKECPGMIKGNFSGEGEGYVLNLLRSERGKTLQQVVYFQSSEGSFLPVVVFPRTAIGVVTVIRKFPPGMYKPARGGNSLKIKTDTIGMSQVDAWTEVYYWAGKQFRHVVTSE